MGYQVHESPLWTMLRDRALRCFLQRGMTELDVEASQLYRQLRHQGLLQSAQSTKLRKERGATKPQEALYRISTASALRRLQPAVFAEGRERRVHIRFPFPRDTYLPYQTKHHRKPPKTAVIPAAIKPGGPNAITRL